MSPAYRVGGRVELERPITGGLSTYGGLEAAVERAPGMPNLTPSVSALAGLRFRF